MYRIGKTTEIESSLVAGRGWRRRGNGEFNGHKVSIWGGEKVLEPNGGGCTAM